MLPRTALAWFSPLQQAGSPSAGGCGSETASGQLAQVRDAARRDAALAEEMLELLLRHQLANDGAVAARVRPVLVGQRVRPEHHRLVVLLARVAAVVLARLQAMHQDAAEVLLARVAAVVLARLQAMNQDAAELLLAAPRFRLARCGERRGGGDGDGQHLQEATARWRRLGGGNLARVRHRSVRRRASGGGQV